MEKIIEIFETNKLTLLIQDSSASFGDKYSVYSDSNIAFRISTIRSLGSIDVRNLNDKNEDWFDLALVKSLLYNETVLNKSVCIDTYRQFLEDKIEVVKEIFNLKNYPSTKLKLKELEQRRIKQMFPKIK